MRDAEARQDIMDLKCKVFGLGLDIMELRCPLGQHDDTVARFQELYDFLGLERTTTPAKPAQTKLVKKAKS